MEQIKYDMRLIYAILNGKISDLLSDLFERNFEAYGMNLDTEEWMIMNVLWHQEGISQIEISHQTTIDTATLYRKLNVMQKKGLIKRKVNDKDGRSNQVYVMEKGWDIKEKANFVANKTLKVALRGLTQEELVTSQEVLRTVYANSSE